MIEVLRLLHDQSVNNTNHTRYSRSYYIRHLEDNEPIPQFGHGITELPFSQKEWIWVAYSYKDDSPIAILVTSPMQGVVMLLRIYSINGSQFQVLVGLLRKAFADMNSRGYTRYSVFLGDDNKAKAKLLRLVLKAGGSIIPGTFIMAHGNTDISKW